MISYDLNIYIIISITIFLSFGQPFEDFNTYIQEGDIAAAERFLAKNPGYDINRKDMYGDRAAIHYVYDDESENDNPLEMLKFLVKKGADINSADMDGWTG